jgi:ComF family protein
MRPIAGTLCSICGERLLSPYAASPERGESQCGLCKRVKPPFVKAAAYGSYEGGLRELIQQLKYQHVRPAAKILGDMLAEAINKLEVSDELSFLVVPVPLHRRKLRERGFNHCELIAEAALKQGPARGRLSMDKRVLKRCRETRSQTGLTRHQRRENVRGAFKVLKPALVIERQILLIDDVFTTGTTVSECARTLLRSGASEVFVATVARTLKGEPQKLELADEIEQFSRSMAAAS